MRFDFFRLRLLPLLFLGAVVSAGAATPPAPPAAPAPAPATPASSAALTPAPASAPSDDEVRASSDLQGAFDAGLFDKVNAGAKGFLQKTPKSPLRFNVLFLQGRALYFLGQYGPALAVFSSSPDAPDALAPSFVFWRAETLAAQANWPEAEKGYRDLLARYAAAPEAVSGQGQLGLAWVLYKEGNGKDARALLASLMQAQPPTESGEKAALVLTKIEIADNHLDAAVATLDALAARKVKPASATAFEADYWRGELALLQGKSAEAIGFFRRVVDSPKAFPQPLVAGSWFDLGSAYRRRATTRRR